MPFFKNEAWTHVRLHPINTIKPRKKPVNHPFKQPRLNNYMTNCTVLKFIQHFKMLESKCYFIDTNSRRKTCNELYKYIKKKIVLLIKCIVISSKVYFKISIFGFGVSPSVSILHKGKVSQSSPKIIIKIRTVTHSFHECHWSVKLTPLVESVFPSGCSNS